MVPALSDCPRASEPIRAEELARRAQAGSSTAFAELYDRYASPVYSLLRVRTGSDLGAEELTQDTFVRAWRKLHTYDSRRSFSTWLYTLARRLAISHERSSRSRRPAASLEPEPASRAGEPIDQLGRAEQRDNLWNLAAEVLSAEQRTALWLRYGEGLAPREIALILGKGPSTVRVLLLRARRALARHLDPAPGAERAAIPVCAPRLAEGVAGGTPA